MYLEIHARVSMHDMYTVSHIWEGGIERERERFIIRTGSCNYRQVLRSAVCKLEPQGPLGCIPAQVQRPENPGS